MRPRVRRSISGSRAARSGRTATAWSTSCTSRSRRASRERPGHYLVRSYDGGTTWTRPQLVTQLIDNCFFVDPVIGRCVEDGIAGARNDLSASPNIDIANGAPSGAGAPEHDRR